LALASPRLGFHPKDDTYAGRTHLGKKSSGGSPPLFVYHNLNVWTGITCDTYAVPVTAVDREIADSFEKFLGGS